MGRLRTRLLVVVLSYLALAGLAGCDRPASISGQAGPESESKLTLIAEADREHDFGAVIASSGRKVEHRYRLRNATQYDVKILNIIIARPVAATYGPARQFCTRAMSSRSRSRFAWATGSVRSCTRLRS